MAGRRALVYAVIFTLALAPLERRVGTRWTVLVFASGHVVASLATELPVLWAVRSQLLPPADAHLLDVGVSYGFFATAGALLLLVPAPCRWWLLAALNGCVLATYLGSGPTSTDAVVTAVGHAMALYVGLVGWAPWARRRGLVGSARWVAGRPPWLAARFRAGDSTTVSETTPAPAGT